LSLNRDRKGFPDGTPNLFLLDAAGKVTATLP
jgi:hypothetical protein